MKKLFKKYSKLNLMSIFFFAVSFISVTLAWFSYSGLANVGMDIPVDAWYVELTKDDQVIHNEVIISASEIYPGMKTVHEEIKIKNLGDSIAELNYKIISARIFDNNLVVEGEEGLLIEDKLAQEYPFHININLSKRYVLNGDEEEIFEISISWPLDSNNDELDSQWGKEAYDFKKSENSKLEHDSTYTIQNPIKIVISLSAEQSLELDTTSDIKYNLGDTILYDVQENRRCETADTTCLITNVIDINNKLGDTTVTLLPIVYKGYIESNFIDYMPKFNSLTSSWNVSKRPLELDDILKIVSTDIMHSYIIRDGLSNTIIGNLNHSNRTNKIVEKVIESKGHFQFLSNSFKYLSTANCYWTNTSLDSLNGFAVVKDAGDTTRIFGNLKTNQCNVVPIIEVSKADLE